MCYCDKIYMKNGYASFRTEDTKLMNSLDAKFKGFFSDLVECEEYHIPALIDGEVLQKCGYFESFPHHLTVAAYVKSECHKDVVANKGIRREDITITNKYFTPAACLHIYPMLEQNFDNKNKTITTRARVYRYEGENFKGLTRLWDFTVREFVFVGTADYVKTMQERIKEKALEFARTITKDARIVNANDHFYPSKQNLIKEKIQQSNSFKFELVIPIKGEDIAVASINFHDTHFSKPFNFDQEGKVVTGCIGFGIERWIAACKEYNIEIVG